MVKVSVVVPAHNEEGTIVQVINRLEHALTKLDYEIVVVNDNSADRTRQLVEKEMKKNSRIRLINRNPPNGFGLALRDGIKNARGQIIIFVMADLCDEVEKIPEMVKKIEEGCDVVIASRFIRGGRVENYPDVKLLANRLCNETIRILYRIPSNDITNAFKAYKAPLLKKLRLESDGFEILSEVIIKLCKEGVKIGQLPTVWKGRVIGTSKMRLAASGFSYLKVILQNL